MSRAEQLALGARIRERRRKLGMRQTELAQRAQITPEHASRVERGTHDVSLSTLKALASALDVPLGALLGGDPPTLTKEGAAFARLFEGAPPDIREAVLKILRQVTGGGRS